MKIVVHSPTLSFRRDVDEELLEMICHAASEGQVVRVRSQEELAAEGADAEILYGTLPEALWPHFPRLRWVQSTGAGVERQLSPAFVESDVILTPHMAGTSQNRPRPTIELFCDNLQHFQKGRALRNLVDKALGF